MKKKIDNTTNKPEITIFEKHNFKFLLIGLGLIFLGFILMLGGGTDSPNEFNQAMFGFRRLTLAPILILAGFAVEIYAIMSKTSSNKKA
ncbi:MAG TPA: DUF3098 domain-containing protein [Bacteroidales bacterium]|nr:DUF3098 domain-containing protein [Bacteroidales bacterium]